MFDISILSIIHFPLYSLMQSEGGAVMSQDM
jgi:hypothetical protein